MPDQSPTPDARELLRSVRGFAEQREAETADRVARAAPSRSQEYRLGAQHAVANYFEDIAEFIDGTLASSPPLPDSGEREVEALLQPIGRYYARGLAEDDERSPGHARALASLVLGAASSPDGGERDGLVQRLDALHDGLVQMGDAPRTVIEEAAALAQMAARLPSSSPPAGGEAWKRRFDAAQAHVVQAEDDLRAARARLDAVERGCPAGGEGDDARGEGLVHGWEAMHGQPTQVEISPNLSGAGHPSPARIGVTYPNGLVRVSRGDVAADVYFGDDGLRVLAWVDQYGERDADLIVEARPGRLVVERARTVSASPGGEGERGDHYAVDAGDGITARVYGAPNPSPESAAAIRAVIKAAAEEVFRG